MEQRRPLIKLVDWSPLAIAGARSALAALTIFLLTGKQLRFNWTAIQIGGALAYAGTVAFFVLATKLTTAANAILLQYTAPLYVAILGFWFLRERTNPFDWLIVLLTLCGIFLFFLDDLSPGNLWGNGFAALSGLCFGLFILCMRKQEDSSPMATVLLGNLVTAAAGLPFMFHTARLTWPVGAPCSSWASSSSAYPTSAMPSPCARLPPSKQF